MRVVIEVGYAVMASWLIVAAVIRLVLQIQRGYALDPIPFLSIAIAIFAFALLAATRRRERSKHQPQPPRGEIV